MLIRKYVAGAVVVVAVLYLIICLLLYFFQENLLFHPQRQGRDVAFSFTTPFEEILIKTEDGEQLSGVFFKSTQSKGLIFYLHGNGGSIASWGQIAGTYTHLGYDLFMLDYRGYGKSSGTISSQEQLFSDVQLAYDYVKSRYEEKSIIILGYSIGTGPAAKLAATNHPGQLILQAPYYNLADMVHHYFPIIPSLILKYTFETNKFLTQCTMPVAILHGDEDEVIPLTSSEKLKPLLKENDNYIVLQSQGHNGMSEHRDYVPALRKILHKAVFKNTANKTGSLLPREIPPQEPEILCTEILDKPYLRSRSTPYSS